MGPNVNFAVLAEDLEVPKFFHLGHNNTNRLEAGLARPSEGIVFYQVAFFKHPYPNLGEVQLAQSRSQESIAKRQRIPKDRRQKTCREPARAPTSKAPSIRRPYDERPKASTRSQICEAHRGCSVDSLAICS